MVTERMFVISNTEDQGPSSRGEPTVADLGEFAVIDRAVRNRIHPPGTVIGPGDDAAVVLASDGRVVVTTDMLVQDRHFRLDWSTPHQIGAKAIAQNGADIAAMGARPTAFLVALGCPGSTSVQVTDGINDGLWAEATRAGAAVVGGDLVSSQEVVISITALGDLENRAPVLRSGARPGDVLALNGVLGWSAAGLAVLSGGISGHDGVVAAHRVPQPCYSAGVDASNSGATSMTDISDGLLADVGHIAESSDVHIDISTELLPMAVELISASRDLAIPPIEWILTGGEDHALVATFPPDVDLPPGWVRIGMVDTGSTVTVDGELRPGSGGWTSF